MSNQIRHVYIRLTGWANDTHKDWLGGEWNPHDLQDEDEG